MFPNLEWRRSDFTLLQAAALPCVTSDQRVEGHVVQQSALREKERNMQ
jgi:hypothetical protein